MTLETRSYERLDALHQTGRGRREKWAWSASEMNKEKVVIDRNQSKITAWWMGGGG